nr:MAG TPA: hypothetical protein [Caudoviricetes sp.]
MLLPLIAGSVIYIYFCGLGNPFKRIAPFSSLVGVISIITCTMNPLRIYDALPVAFTSVQPFSSCISKLLFHRNLVQTQPERALYLKHNNKEGNTYD